MAFISVGENQLSYNDAGKGRTILFIHGFCGSKEYWQEVIPLLADGFRVLAVDLRGHGESDNTEDFFEIEDMARDIHYFLDQKFIEDVFLVGHSLGGYVTLAFAELFPEKLNGFSLVHSTAYPDTQEGKEARTKSIEVLSKDGIEPFIDSLIPKLFADTSSPKKVDRAKEIGYHTSLLGAKGALKAMRNREDRNEVIENSNVPVLLIAGEKDKVIPLEKTFSVKAPHVTEVTIKDSGHMGMYEQPEILAEEIREFMNENFS